MEFLELQELSHNIVQCGNFHKEFEGFYRFRSYENLKIINKILQKKSCKVKKSILSFLERNKVISSYEKEMSCKEKLLVFKLYKKLIFSPKLYLGYLPIVDKDDFFRIECALAKKLKIFLKENFEFKLLEEDK